MATIFFQNNFSTEITCWTRCFINKKILPYFWVKLLLRSGVAVRTTVPIFTSGRVTPFVAMFYVRTWRRPAIKTGKTLSEPSKQ